MKEIYYIGVGSNIGDREGNIRHAADTCQELFENFESSRLYETLPRYMEDQPRFLNCVFSGISASAPDTLLAQLQQIENSSGRNRDASGWMGPRTLDLDILLVGTSRINTESLVVPHPRMTERKFVLVPLLDIEPTLSDPVTGRLYIDFLEELEPQGIYYHSVKSV